MNILGFFHRTRLALTLATVLAMLISPSATLLVSADPGGPIHIIVVRKATKLSHGPTRGGGGVTPDALVSTDLGGVTAYSIAGLQYREGVFYVDVSGMNESSTSANIDELETHGALVHSESSSDCYYGEIMYIFPSKYNYNASDVSYDWSPFQTRTKTNCFTQTSGHFYVYNGARTDVSEPDVFKIY